MWEQGRHARLWIWKFKANSIQRYSEYVWNEYVNLGFPWFSHVHKLSDFGGQNGRGHFGSSWRPGSAQRRRRPWCRNDLGVNNCQHVSTTKLLGASRRNFDMCLLVNLGPDACLNYTPMPRVYETKQTADPAWQALLQLLAAQLVGSFNLLEPWRFRRIWKESIVILFQNHLYTALEAHHTAQTFTRDHASMTMALRLKISVTESTCEPSVASCFTRILVTKSKLSKLMPYDTYITIIYIYNTHHI